MVLRTMRYIVSQSKLFKIGPKDQFKHFTLLLGIRAHLREAEINTKHTWKSRKIQNLAAGVVQAELSLGRFSGAARWRAAEK